MTVNVIDITVEDVNSQILTYTQIQIERASSYAGSYSLIDTETLVADQYVYPVTDDTGTIDSWYRWRLYNPTGPVSGDYTTPFNVVGASRLRIRQTMIQDFRAGIVFLAGSTGDATHVQTDDYRVKNTAWSDGRGKKQLLYVAQGTGIGQARYILNSDVSLGSFLVDTLTTPLAAGDQVEWHYLPSMSIEVINQMINKGLQRYYYLDRVPVAGITNNNEYSLEDYGWVVQSSDICGLWYYPRGQSEIARPWQGEGRWWNWRMDNGVITLKIYPTISETDVVYLEVLRPMPALYDDTTLLPANADLDLCAAFAYDECLKYLLRATQGGTTQDYTGWQVARRQHKEVLSKLIHRNTPKINYAFPATDVPQFIRTPWRAR